MTEATLSPAADGRPTPVTPPPPPASDDALLDALLDLRRAMLALEGRFAAAIERVPPARRPSARNLLHYLALRSRDIRPLQGHLSRLGLSSLGRCEAHALATVDAVARALSRLLGRPALAPIEVPLDADGAAALLEARTRDLLGPDPVGRRTRIVVTLPGEARADAGLLVELARAGADAVRINCAHDDPDTWARLVAHARAAGQAVGRRLTVLVDLGGPKLRTGPLAPGPRVVTWRPRRDAYGRVVTPARIWLRPEGVDLPPPGPADAVLPVPGAWLAAVVPGDSVRLLDARGASRRLDIVDASGAGRWAEGRRRAYVVPGTPIVRRPAGGGPAARAEVGDLPATERRVPLAPGDRLVLVGAEVMGSAAVRDPDGGAPGAARLGCTLPEAVRGLRPGHRVLLDDGHVAGVVESGPEGDPAEVVVRVTHARPGVGIGPDKGVNLPDLEARLPALTTQDLTDLDAVAPLLDLVGLSFVQDPLDVARLGEALVARGRADAGVVLKVETRRAFEALPGLLLAALVLPRAGVMIARGDLAVECGFERMAEAQEEVLWLCEAAHLPAIWATQVLEQLTKHGQPSRAEITDAAAGERAEAVMLNKGPHVVDAVRTLDDVLRRMQGHQDKKRAVLRPLRLAQAVVAGATAP